MKTAISIPDPIFEAIDLFAKKEKISRSEVFVTAVKEFLQRYQNKKILEKLNSVYGPEDKEEKETFKKLKGYQSKLIQKNNSW